MTTPNVRSTCTGTCHPETGCGWTMRRESAANRAYRVLLDMGANVTWRHRLDTGTVHGPAKRPTAQFHPWRAGITRDPWDASNRRAADAIRRETPR
jgi:hypothetical protein